MSVKCQKVEHTTNPLPDRLESLILQLSVNLNSVSEKLEKNGIDDLETKLTEKISTMIDNKLKDKMEEVKSEVKTDIEQLQSKLDILEKKQLWCQRRVTIHQIHEQIDLL